MLRLGSGGVTKTAKVDGEDAVLLVHGFPETWWVFHKLIPLLSGQHRVFAVDLRG
ncbi:alpha/beta fold hydrolase, partial [Streptomyces antimycoticus]|uniref:alpha/beta fold hydrolase n=1 Tax=Streptomyces antimycoticus TaxID=68175 RepID=UPI0030B86414